MNGRGASGTFLGRARLGGKFFPTRWVFGTCLGVFSAIGAPGNVSAKVSEKEEIQCLAVERIRSEAADYERVMVAAEGRIRGLYGEVDPLPPALDQDLRALRGACQRVQRGVAAGRRPPPDSRAQQIIEEKWRVYQIERDRRMNAIKTQQRDGVAESRIYWESLRAFSALRERVSKDLLFNTPPGERSLDRAFERDEVALLKACETTKKKTRAPSPRVVAPQEYPGGTRPDVQAFYRTLDMVPTTPATRVGSFGVPPGARTVTLRETGARLVFRPRRGEGIAYLGQSETEIHYGYIVIAPDTAYYFENTGTEPLELEFVAVKP